MDVAASERDGGFDEPENRESAIIKPRRANGPGRVVHPAEGRADVTLCLCLGQDTQTKGPIGGDFGP